MTACSDDSLQLYNAKDGKHVKSLLSKKYGCHLARFSHNSQSIVYASTKVDDDIRYLATSNNSFIRYFKGHTSAVTSLEVSPVDDNFISCSLDDTVRIWSLNSPNAQGGLNVKSPLHVAYDPPGVVFAVACPRTESIFLYDVRNYDRGPVTTFYLPHNDALARCGALRTALELAGLSVDDGLQSLLPRAWTKVEFSNDGQFLLIGTTSPIGHFILDAFHGNLHCILALSQRFERTDVDKFRAASLQHPSAAQAQGDVVFSPDSRYVIGSDSSGGNKVVVWDLQGLINKDKTLLPAGYLPHQRSAGILEWNPRYNMIASAEKDVVMWQPDENVRMKSF